MTVPLWVLLAFSAWTLGLVLVGIGPIRLLAVSRREMRASQIRSDVPHGSERYQRLMRAHVNCVENLPLLAVLVFTAELIGLRSGWMSGLAITLMVGRIGQTTAHIYSGRGRAILVRFSCFVVQVLCMVAMGVLIAVHAGGER